MKHVLPFELFELNKVSKYYRDNPEQLHHEADLEWETSEYNHEVSPTLQNRVKLRLHEIQAIFVRRFALRLMVSQEDVKRLYESLFAGMESQSEYEGKPILPNKVLYGSFFRGLISETPSIKEIGIQAAIDETYDYFVSLVNKTNYLTQRKHTQKVFNKLCVQRHVNPLSARPALRALQNFRWSTERTIDPMFFAVLRKLTVNPKQLPKTLWRGMTISLYHNPDDLIYSSKEDLEKVNVAKWSVGSKPASTKNEVMSWSTSKAVASSFMSDEGNKSTMHVMCRYDNPTYEQIVCDTRAFHDSEYWGEQEITLTADALDYVVDQVFISDDKGVLINAPEYKEFKKVTTTRQVDLSAQSFSSFLAHPFDYRDYSIKTTDRLQIKAALNTEVKMKGTGGISNIGTGVTPGIYQCLEIIRRKSGNVQDGLKVNADTVTFNLMGDFLEADASGLLTALVSCTLKQRLASINKFVFDLTIHLNPASNREHMKLLISNEATRNHFKNHVLTWFEYYKHVTVNVLFDGI